MCSSPCNEGLALELDRQAISAGLKIETVWWDGNILTDFYTRGLFALIPQSNALAGSQWFKGAGDKTRLSNAEVSQIKDRALTAEILISDVSVDREAGTFRAEFGVRVYNKAGAPRVFGPRTYTGSTKQLRWFVRRSAPFPRMVPSAFGAFVLVVLVWFVVGYHRSIVLPAERKMGWICILAGLFFLCAVFYGVRFRRRRAFYYKPNNLFFLVDRNSELILGRPGRSGQNTPPGPEFVIERTCLDVLENIKDRKYGYAEKPFWKWVFSGGAWQYLYKPPKYELNQRWNPFLHFCSGREGEGVTHTGISTRRYFTQAFSSQISPKGYYRESRLVSPVIEVQALATQYGIPEDQPKVAMLFTSACAPYEQEVRNYLQALSELERRGRTTNPVAAFTVFFPTLPRTGSNSMYQFEEGKLLLASLGADTLVRTNEKGYDLARAWQNMTRQLQVQDLILKAPTFAQQTLRTAPSVQIPIYQLTELGWTYREKWDTPTDLEARRADLLALKNTQEVGQQCEEIATRFVDFVKNRVLTEQQPEHTIHVLEAKRKDMFVLLTVVAVVLGFLIFSSQYNMTFLHHYLEQKSIRIWDWTCLLGSGVFLVLFFFWSMWRRHETAFWAFRGWADVAFCSIVSLWLALFAAPFVIFRLYCWSYNRGRNPLRDVRAISAAMVMCFVSVVLYCNTFIDSHALRFIAAFVPCLAVVLICLVEFARTDLIRLPYRGLLGIWRFPTVACFIKCLLIAFLARLIHGTINASGGALEREPYVISTLWVVIGVLIINARRLTI